MIRIILLFFTLTSTVLAQITENCSSISLASGDTVIMGRNHDENLSNCLVVYNPRGLYKEGFEFENESYPKWSAKYASITFNILGAGFAILGMNENGLAIGHMGFREAKYPPKDERPVLDQIQFITYILDNCANTSEVIKTSNEIRIDDESITREHYFACDKSGELAIIEPIEGHLVIYTNETIPYPIISNDSYQKSLDYLKSYQGFSGELPIPDKTFGVEEIMAIGASKIEEFNSKNKKEIVNSAFSILHDIGFNKYPPPEGVDVHPNYGTQFTTVFDLKNLVVYFRTKSNSRIRRVDFDYFDASCLAGIKMLEIENTEDGIVNNLFTDYTAEKNKNYLTEWNKQSNPLSNELIDFLSKYADTFMCR
ncbi:linear amide C-N hydrolase [candidate division KSB1 bacterium]|nr:linear amide C-N hydrolase [candidate division KSB1 bacterium]